MMRFDKLLAELNIGSRSEVKELIKKGLVLIDGKVVKDSSVKVDENIATITYKDIDYSYVKYRYFIMNKPAGIVTADTDKNDTTVMDVFRNKTGNQYTKGFFPVGRLDKDTVGLILITNDGDLSHKLLSPKGHVDKTYFVKTQNAIDDESVLRLEKGVEIEKDLMTLPAKVFRGEDEYCCFLTIHEGKFHQVKRMFEKCNNKVVYLKRTSFGPLTLPEDLEEGSVRECLSKEVNELYDTVK